MALFDADIVTLLLTAERYGMMGPSAGDTGLTLLFFDACDDPPSVAADPAHVASLLAGMAFGTAGTHLSHAIQYPVGALTHTPHGLGTGMLLPYVMQAVLDTDARRLANIAEALGVAAGSTAESAQNAIDEVAAIMADIGLPNDLATIGVTEADLPRIVELSLTVRRLVTNSVLEPTEENLHRIVRAALSGDRAELKPVPTAASNESENQQ